MEKEYENAENINEEINDSDDPVVVLCDDEDEDLRAKLDAEKAKADEYLLTARRLQAEFDNYRKRTNETNKRVKEDGNVEVLIGLLPVLDSFVQAEKMIEDQKTLDGIAIIKRQMEDLLSRFNVKKIEALGCEFDPNFHNAIMQMDVAEDEKKNTVVEVYQEGYTIGDRVLRVRV